MLPVIEFAYNSTHHTAIGMSPFEADLGRIPTALTPILGVETGIIDPKSLKEELTDIKETVRISLQAAQDTMINTSRKSRYSVKYDPGEWVWLNNDHFTLSSDLEGINRKLVAKWSGPYRVVNMPSEVTVRLEMPDTIGIHPIFHLSQVKKAIGTTESLKAGEGTPVEQDTPVVVKQGPSVESPELDDEENNSTTNARTSKKPATTIPIQYQSPAQPVKPYITAVIERRFIPGGAVRYKVRWSGAHLEESWLDAEQVPEELIKSFLSADKATRAAKRLKGGRV